MKYENESYLIQSSGDAFILATAIACHNNNRYHCITIGDNSQGDFFGTPENIRASGIDGVRKILSGEITTPEESHKSWLAFKKEDGWVFGSEKSTVDKTHPCMVPYSDLPREQQVKDKIFFATVNACKEVLLVAIREHHAEVVGR